MGNSRGNTFSNTHIEYDKDKNERKYWDFSWAEMGLYDLPAMFDKVTDVTGVEKLSYIGHSQGTTQMFYALAETQEYIASKVNVFVAFAPITKIANTDSEALQWASVFYNELDDAANVLGIHALAQSNFITDWATSFACTVLYFFCSLI